METSISHDKTGDEVNCLYGSIKRLIDQSRSSVAVTVNTALCLLNYAIGKHITHIIGYKAYDNYGKSILATVSQKLTAEYGRGYTYSALTRMIKVANTFDSEMFATLSQTLSWSHFIELASIEGSIKRLYYQQMSVHNGWSLRELRRREDEMDYERSLVAAKPEDDIITALTASNPTSNPDVMLKILCSEGNTEHIELMMLGDDNIKVAQYLTELPEKKWFADKLTRSIEIAKSHHTSSSSDIDGRQ